MNPANNNPEPTAKTPEPAMAPGQPAPSAVTAGNNSLPEPVSQDKASEPTASAELPASPLTQNTSRETGGQEPDTASLPAKPADSDSGYDQPVTQQPQVNSAEAMPLATTPAADDKGPSVAEPQSVPEPQLSVPESNMPQASGGIEGATQAHGGATPSDQPQ